MPTNWKAMCRCDGMKLDADDVVTVTFANDRTHRVQLVETEHTIEVHAIVARAAAVRHITDLPLQLWRRNRSAQLVSFRLDSRDRVAAQGWVPLAGLTAHELQQVISRVAGESDRLEFALTEKDVE